MLSPQTNSFVLPNNGWGFELRVDGADIVCDRGMCTFFGGTAAQDPEDNGETSSGLSTRENPSLLGCALPVVHTHATPDSPLPRIPWHTQVEVTAGGKSLIVPLIDNGPSKSCRHAIDLTRAAWMALGLPFSLGVMPVSYRIYGGAQFLAKVG